MSEWQPVETAPRDGTYFLAYDLEMDQYWVCFWDKREEWFSDGNFYDKINLTHWQPLPTPPVKS